jgi:rep
MVIRDRRKTTTADIIVEAEKASHQTDIYDFL